MADPNKMILTDGTKFFLPRSLSRKSEFYNLLVAVKSDPMILHILCEQYFYTWRKPST